jgi:hypothetical protein
MNPENKETNNGSFYEPRTIPKKWDVSAFVSRTTSASNGTDEQPTESIEQPGAECTEDEGANWNPDPFPQPRTIPGKWDVSEMK